MHACKQAGKEGGGGGGSNCESQILVGQSVMVWDDDPISTCSRDIEKKQFACCSSAMPVYAGWSCPFSCFSAFEHGKHRCYRIGNGINPYCPCV